MVAYSLWLANVKNSLSLIAATFAGRIILRIMLGIFIDDLLGKLRVHVKFQAFILR